MRRTRTTTHPFTDESRLFYIALTCCFLVIGTYMYFVSLSVVHVVMRKEIDMEIRDVATALSGLEAEYIERQHAVSEDVASMKGFVVAREKIFIDKGDDTLVLSRN